MRSVSEARLRLRATDGVELPAPFHVLAGLDAIRVQGAHNFSSPSQASLCLRPPGSLLADQLARRRLQCAAREIHVAVVFVTCRDLQRALHRILHAPHVRGGRKRRAACRHRRVPRHARPLAVQALAADAAAAGNSGGSRDILPWGIRQLPAAAALAARFRIRFQPPRALTCPRTLQPIWNLHRSAPRAGPADAGEPAAGRG
mmetsp:Transcript_115532/g.331615  ORF Transcript_115532/g.331615 Transcript_115532/m.331615 type:complete len:202 (+) Transcript_115532:380-985(+)